MKKKTRNHKILDFTGAMVLGMHDAVVSLTGIIVGLTFAGATAHLIVLTSIIASVAASLSMTASNYLAEKTAMNPNAIIAGFYTGGAYLITSSLLITPFMIFNNSRCALAFTLAIAVLTIFGFNFCVYRVRKMPFMRRFLEMIAICAAVSIVAFGIGLIAKYWLGLDT